MTPCDQQFFGGLLVGIGLCLSFISLSFGWRRR